MLRSLKRFLRDERGNVTIESLVVIGGSVWMMGVVVGDISVATMGVTERLENRLEYSSIINDILDSHGPDSELAGGSGDDPEFCDANPGNEKCVGNAGENPNGGDDWGSGSNGMSDSGSTGSSSSSGNSGNAPGKNK